MSLEIVGLDKSYGGVAVLRDISFTVRAGTVVGLMGPNGAGKSTLLNIVSGIERADGGRITIAGVRSDCLRADGVAKLGVARTFQTPQAFPHLTVRDNVVIGGYLRTPRIGAVREVFGFPVGRSARRGLERRADAFIEFFGLQTWADGSPNGLPPAAAKMLDLSRALMQAPGVLILDEPAAGLNGQEREGLRSVLRAVAGAGVSILAVEHDMGLLFGCADEIVVLDAGAVLVAGPPTAVRGDPAFAAAYFGTEVEDDHV